MKRLLMSGDQKGAVLMVTMMILLILTVLGVAAISTTTSELRIAANAKFQTLCFYGADGGARMYEPILKSALYNRTLTVAPPVTDPNLLNELLQRSPNDGATDDAINSPDLSTTVGGMTVGVDIDVVSPVMLAGGSAEFASGYEGIGASLASGGSAEEYQVTSVCRYGQSQAQISSLYIYHPNN